MTGTTVKDAEGTYHYDNDGKLHCDDGPAIKYNNGAEYWYVHGVLHRDGNLPAVTDSLGVWWYSHGELVAHDATGKWRDLCEEFCDY